jgi:pimeloyl-ACP methyl ester carboxylesterase
MMVDNGAVRIATSDVGGGGPALVLMHGLGPDRSSLDKLVAHLGSWRVITMDLRGHGESTSGPWDFDAAVSDVETVVRHYGLERPWVGGHSLGGMIALRYAIAGHPVAGVVNIDGWGPGVVERYLDEDPDVVARELDRYADGLPLVARLLMSRTRLAREGTYRAVLRLLYGTDVVAWHREAPCPSLAFNAVAPNGRLQGLLLGGRMGKLQPSLRRGLRRDLAALAQERPDVKVAEVDAQHFVITSHPALVAAEIDGFRDEVLRR